MSALSTRPAQGRALFGRFSDYGWGRRGLLVAVALLGSAAFAYGANLASRLALWQIVGLCAIDKETTGSPFPCLEVNLAQGRARGFAVLRPPIGSPDTILTPTARIVGLEDPRLQAAEAPNYFALAWDERRWLEGAAEDRLALAVNSRLSRSQDQLHIHMGCIASDFAEHLANDALGPKTATWFRAPDLAPGLELWTYRSGAKDLAGLAPFRLLKDLVGDPGAMRRTTLGTILWKREFVVIALRSRPGGWYAAAEDVLDAKC